ncbi:adenylate/guanylate cyclase domain-containing protein [Paucibacter sp. XJ19-41]|uniref:adenylate/guanylate cyclase domain-containing protein n=1 Tax=Paucibacter sp. XJ19-41 TaxID=2927824 RepID=UPI00234A95D8|nr:adenylate/guanylate cyclase domain-containing protein [Paucibacter sp. XJ19-41]MDC6167047.1 adenylate/guanylate cyclase domain-containing protein [Paucibacter sp. XJ19-41]
MSHLPDVSILAEQLVHRRQTLLVVDMVESVRLMHENEVDVVWRWRTLVGQVRETLLPVYGGRMVKSLGDGLLLVFADIAPAVEAALAIQRLPEALNRDRSAHELLLLRVGVHTADVMIDELDVYGSGVNVAARLAAMAGPGEVIVSVEVRDSLADGLNADIQDLGDCYLKNLPEPLRAFRLRPPDSSRLRLMPDMVSHQVGLAVIPPRVPFGTKASDQALGDALADDIITSLSRCPGLRLVSRLSCSALRLGHYSLDDYRRLLGVNYVLSGSLISHGDKVRVHLELVELRSAAVLWSGTESALVDALFAGQDEMVPAIVAQVSRAIASQETQRTRRLPLPSLEAFTLYIGGVTLLHRLNASDFEASHALLDHLAQRVPRSAAPLAMLGKWHLMKLLQGWTNDARHEGLQAQAMARRALDLQPDHAFALATDALITAHFGTDLLAARQRGELAIQVDPQEPHGWRVLAGIHSYLGDGSAAERCALHAIMLSPLDPLRFQFDTMAGAAMLASKKYQDAEQWARLSLQRNRMHVASHRLLTISLALAGKLSQSRAAAADLLRISPEFRLRTYAQQYPGRDQPHARAYLEALRVAGLPE